MTKALLWSAPLTAALFVGCASDGDYGARSYYDGERDVVVHTDGTRTYVREQESPHVYRDYSPNRSRMQPEYRGKHPDALGWNDPYRYDSSRY